MTNRRRQHDESGGFLRWSETRTGGVYIAVLGTSLIVALLSIAALTQQRIQNRTLTASDDIRQAQLNANTALELALLTMKQSANWRAAQPHGQWFAGRDTGAGSCTVIVTDPADSSLANSPDDPVLLQGIGYSGQAVQRVEITVDPRKEPLGCLRSAVAAGDLISLQSDTLRTNGLISANQVSASSSLVFGDVEAVSVSGGTYAGITTQIPAEKRPSMPDWDTVFNYYRTAGVATELNIASLTAPLPNLGKNVSIESNVQYWTGEPPGVPKANISDSANQVRTGNKAMRIRDRESFTAGAAQLINGFVEPDKQYYIEAYIYVPLLSLAKNFRITIYTKGTGGPVQVASGPDTPLLTLGWRQLAATITAPAWSGNLEYAFVKFAGADSGNSGEFYLDDLTIREAYTGRVVYRKVLGAGVNTWYPGAPTNPQGLYWINCNGERLVITKSRICGTLLVVNPGPNSCIADGAISWNPSLAGYPALMVDAQSASDADFGIFATNRALSETENGVNFNPVGAPHDQFGVDADLDDIYPSEIRGMIVIRDDLTFANRALVSGQIIVGDDISNSSGELEVQYQPESLLSPPPGFLAPYSYPRRPASARKVVQ